MESLLFENPLPIYIAACVSEITLVILWMRTRERAFTLAIPPLVCALLAVLAASVETDRERIIAITEEVVEYGNRNDFNSAIKYLDADFTYRDLTRDEAIEKAQEGKERHHIQSIVLTGIKVEVEDDRAEARVYTTMKLSQSEYGQEAYPVLWKVTWIKRPEGWRVLEVKRPKIGGF